MVTGLGFVRPQNRPGQESDPAEKSFFLQLIPRMFNFLMLLVNRHYYLKKERVGVRRPLILAAVGKGVLEAAALPARPAYPIRSVTLLPPPLIRDSAMEGVRDKGHPSHSLC